MGSPSGSPYPRQTLNKAVGKMRTGTRPKSDNGNGMVCEWERSDRGNVREWESKHCSRAPLVIRYARVFLCLHDTGRSTCTMTVMVCGWLLIVSRDSRARHHARCVALCRVHNIVGFVAAAVSMSTGGCRTIRPVGDVSVTVEPAVL